MRNPIPPFVRPLLALFLIFSLPTGALAAFQQTSTNYNEYKGQVVSGRDQDPLAGAYLSVENTNISTVTNSDGEFSLKVPENLDNVNVLVSYLGYQSRTLPLRFFSAGSRSHWTTGVAGRASGSEHIHLYRSRSAGPEHARQERQQLFYR